MSLLFHLSSSFLTPQLLVSTAPDDRKIQTTAASKPCIRKFSCKLHKDKLTTSPRRALNMATPCALARIRLVHLVSPPQTTASINFPPEQQLSYLIFMELTRRSCRDQVSVATSCLQEMCGKDKYTRVTPATMHRHCPSTPLCSIIPVSPSPHKNFLSGNTVSSKI